jgi:hypothetical protein
VCIKDAILKIKESHFQRFFSLLTNKSFLLKGIVSRDFVVCFLVSFDRSYISTHQEWVLLLLKVCFNIEFFDFRVRP